MRRDTAPAHRRLEATLDLLGPELDAARYQRILELLYGFYVPVEHALTRFAATLPFPLRARAAQLEDDLSVLGLSRAEISAVPRCDAIPALTCRAELAGCLYVLEGASLGGQIIAPVLRRRLGVAKGSGASFFVGDGERTAARWAVVLAWLEALERSDACSGPIVAAANVTFEALERWADRRAPRRGHRRRGDGRPERL